MFDKNGRTIAVGDLVLVDCINRDEGIVHKVNSESVIVRDNQDQFFSADPKYLEVKGKQLRIGGVAIPFTDETPTQEGTYLWQNSMGVEVINVRTRSTENYGGLHFEPYLGVVEFRGRAVAALRGKFAKIEGV